jgi:hypothetical protein
MKFFLPNARALSTATGGAFAALLVSFGSLAHGQGYTTTFDPSEGYQANYTLSDQLGWVTNDESTGATIPGNANIGIGQSDFVGILGGYSASGSDYWGLLGGGERPYAVPGTSPVYLDHPFNVAGSASYNFNVQFSISSSATPYPNNDSFAWSFGTASNPTLFSIDYAPTTVVIGGISTTVDSVRYSVNGVQTPTGEAITQNTSFQLSVAVNVTGKSFGFSMTPTVAGASLPIVENGISLGTLDPSTVTQVAATWILSNTAADANGGLENGGSNSLLFNNYSVTVPEPSTWVMLGLGTVALLVMIRRKARA